MAAEPNSGSALLDEALSASASRPDPVLTGFTPIDKILGGGFGYGEITSIAGATQTGKTLIAMHAIAGHFLANQSSEVAVIDTTGSFSPLRLRDVLLARLTSAKLITDVIGDTAPHNASLQASESGKYAKLTIELLSRVRIMRIFDVSGLHEAIEELRALSSDSGNVKTSAATQIPDKNTEIASSQEDEEKETTEGLYTRDPLGMIVIDNLANVIGPEMSKNQNQGQSSLSFVLRTLAGLSRRYNVCTILINATVGVASSVASRNQNRQEPVNSIFGARSGRPGLGKTFAHLIDLSILLSNIGTQSRDPKTAEGRGEAVIDYQGISGIFEITEDKTSDRESSWVPFMAKDGTKIERFS